MTPGFYVSAGLLTPEHMRRIGPALGEFLWLISHETRHEGKVLNGSPITIGRIAADLGESDRTAGTNLRRLEAEGYIVRKRESVGHQYAIANSKKWAKGSEENFLSDRKKVADQIGRKLPEGSEENFRCNKEVDKVDIVDISTPPKTGATHPNLEDVILYCQERGKRVDPHQWFDYYQSNGWKVGRNSMKDWKAAVRYWERNQKGNSNGKAERRQANNLAARDRIRAEIMAGR